MPNWPEEKTEADNMQRGQEVSMEEILASIRKIITSDEESSDSSTSSAPQTVATPPIPELSPLADTETFMPEEEDILELTEMPSSPKSMLDLNVNFSSFSVPPSSPKVLDDFISPSSVVLEDIQGKSMEELWSGMGLGFDTMGKECTPSQQPDALKTTTTEAFGESSPLIIPRIDDSAHCETRIEKPDKECSSSIVNAETEAAAMHSLGVLHQTLKKKEEAKPPVFHQTTDHEGHGLTVEDFLLKAVHPLLHDMLKQWMAHHLSPLIERIVREEISKIVAQSDY